MSNSVSKKGIRNHHAQVDNARFHRSLKQQEVQRRYAELKEYWYDYALVHNATGVSMVIGVWAICIINLFYIVR